MSLEFSAHFLSAFLDKHYGRIAEFPNVMKSLIPPKHGYIFVHRYHLITFYE